MTNMKHLRKKKGVLDIEFMISIMVFLTAIAFVSFSLVNNIPKLHQESLSQDIKSKAFQISELLMFDQGWPTNWNTLLPDQDGQVNRLGLSGGNRYFLDSEKVTKLNTYCTIPGKYDKIKDLLGLDFRNEVSIEIHDTDLIVKMDCKPPVTSQVRPKATITRIAIDSATNKILIMTVSVL